jgi:predicted dehydrogenase
MQKCALIGDGYWGNILKKYISEFFELVFIADSRTDLNILWKDTTIPIVIIATPMETHSTIVNDALVHGKHVFVEKPLSFRIDTAEHLKSLANTMNVALVTDYIYTFSPSIQYILDNYHTIGNINFIEMVIRQFGKFRFIDVFWTLASHLLAVLDMFTDISQETFEFRDEIYYGGVCTSGLILSDNATIKVSVESPHKDVYFNFYSDNGIIEYTPRKFNTVVISHFVKEYNIHTEDMPIKTVMTKKINESNNIYYALNYFKDVIEGKKESNIDRAIKVTRTIQQR